MVDKILVSFANSNDQYDDFIFNYFVNQSISAGTKLNLVMILETVESTCRHVWIL